MAPVGDDQYIGNFNDHPTDANHTYRQLILSDDGKTLKDVYSFEGFHGSTTLKLQANGTYVGCEVGGVPDCTKTVKRIVNPV